MALIERWTADLLDARDNVIRQLSGITNGEISWSILSGIWGSGSIEFRDVEEISWFHQRIGIKHWVGDEWEQAGIWVPTVPEWNYVYPARFATLELLDKTTLLNGQTGRWIAAGVDTPVTTQMRDLLVKAGHTKVNIEDSPKKLSTPLTFDPTVSLLYVLNTLAKSIGYGDLHADLLGFFVSGPYVEPEKRGISASYGAEGNFMHRKFSDSAELFDVPNVVKIIGPASEWEPSIEATARNDDPDSPLSTVNRGEVYAVEEHDVSDVETAKALAKERLSELSEVTRRVTWSHPWDGTWLEDVVEITPLRERLNIIERVVNLRPGGNCRSTGRRFYREGDAPEWL